MTAGTRRARALLIAGPTTSGKSAVALDVAARRGGVVINADSMQVYADLPILAAQPSEADRARAPHLLFGHRDAADPFSVGRWLEEMRSVLDRAADAGRLALVVGGTGLYFKALVQGLSAIPPVPDAIRASVRAEAEGVAAEDLHRRLAALDPLSAARLRPTDPQRIIRALEVFAATGRSLTRFQDTREPPLLPLADTVALFLTPDRAALNHSIETRFDAMMAAGALDEAAALAGRRLDPTLPAMRALGVPPLLSHLAGDLTLEAAVAAAKAQTRAYAKRQMTFGRHQLVGFLAVAPEAAIAAAEAAMG